MESGERVKVVRERDKAPVTPEGQVGAFILHQKTFGGRRGTGATKATVRTYEELLKKGGYSWARPEPDGCDGSFDAGAVEDYLTRTKGRVAEVTYVKIIRHLKAFFKWAEGAYGIPNPLSGEKWKIHNPYEDMLPKEVPDRTQVDAMLAACDDRPDDTPEERFVNRRDRFLLGLYAGSGLRRVEVLNARVGDVDPAQRTIRIVGKGNVEDIVPITLGTVQSFKRYMAVRPDAYPEDHLIVDGEGAPLKPDYVTKLTARIARAVGLKKAYAPHAFRHFAAVESMRQTGDLAYTQKLLRHSTLTMTLKYARMAGIDVRAKHRRFSPID